MIRLLRRLKQVLLTGEDKLIPMLDELDARLASEEIRSRVDFALSRAAASAASRQIDPENPASWEFAGFSQHGEDGILDYLFSRLLDSNQFFLEIGSGIGIENCTAWLAIARNFVGVMIDGSESNIEFSRKAFEILNIHYVHLIQTFVDEETCKPLVDVLPVKNPDVFSLDIDSIDYYVARTMFNLGFRPKIVVVEYNSVFGPELSVTVPNGVKPNRFEEHYTGLYYGVSLNGWRSFFSKFNYQLLTIERNGTNAFFVDPAAFPFDFVSNVKGLSFRNNHCDINGITRVVRRENQHDRIPSRDWKDQLPLLKGCKLNQIEGVDLHEYDWVDL